MKEELTIDEIEGNTRVDTDNNVTRLPIVVLIDTSYSLNRVINKETGECLMTPDNKFVLETKKTKDEVVSYRFIDLLRDEFKSFREAINSSSRSRNAADVCIIEFNDDPKIVVNFGDEEGLENYEPPYNGQHCNATKLVSTFRKAIAIAENRKQVLKASYTKYYQPWFILLTDGIPHDDPNDLKEIQEELKQLQKDQKLYLMSMAITAIDGKKDPTDGELFKFLSQFYNPNMTQGLQTCSNPKSIKEFFRYFDMSLNAFLKTKDLDKTRQELDDKYKK